MRLRIASICCSVVIGDSTWGAFSLPGGGAGPALLAGGTGMGRVGVAMTAEPGGGAVAGPGG